MQIRRPTQNKQLPDGAWGLVLSLLVHCNKKYCIAQIPIKEPFPTPPGPDRGALTLLALGAG